MIEAIVVVVVILICGLLVWATIERVRRETFIDGGSPDSFPDEPAE